ncbi:MAG: apolipoprotein N-acyltransferase [candidate division KSB1 bacterium]|nr:apolipoprotein N-acyltransferase [candidate division KSB1 bacterium]MDZ7272489.1 apolipoprotein N-acyltransferase [candidate division KSB1 bacterium]MDZ7284487.1 apolipoprotein N-acyltransferase [candidate division KSB1 bacterium]MDZ7297117.1 apolipoprotein N-acyltransferase [candidate division KSB1 bacterium]MDZ7306565.1 apolipoprotein N-acyltransferase [candidate division KSB1 bacterium]
MKRSQPSPSTTVVRRPQHMDPSAPGLRRLKLFMAITGGCLGFLSYPAINWTPLVAIAYVPYFWLLNHCSGIKETVRYTWLYSFVMALGGFFWIAYTVVEFGGLPWWLAVPIMLLYAAVGAANLAVTGGLVAWLRRPLSMKWQVLWVPAVFVLVERFFPKLFDWYVGNAIYKIIPLIQIADLGGPFLLTFQILLVNYAIFALLEPGLRHWLGHNLSPAFDHSEKIITAGAGMAMLLFSLGYGHFRLHQVEEQMRCATHKNIGVVQGNLGNYERLQAQYGDTATIYKFFEVHRDLTRKLIQPNREQLDLVLWPEGGYPYPFPEFHPTHQELADLAERAGAPIVTGGYVRERKPVYKIYNSMSLTAPGKFEPVALYKKHILLAFGEYMPFADWFPALKDWIPAVSTFGTGPGPEVMIYGDFRLAPLICYEALSPHYMRVYDQKNANLILNVTNDSWYSRFQEPEQHLALSQLRCVEARMAQVRSTNTGISAVILPSGEITHRTAFDTAACFTARVPLMEMPPTIYARYGDWLVALLGVLVAGMLAMRWWQKKNKKAAGEHRLPAASAL